MSKGICNINKPIGEIITHICEKYGMEIEDIKGKCRENYLIWPRHLAMYMCYQAGHTTLIIGKAFNRSRSMANHAINSVHTLCSVYPKLNKERLEIAKELQIIE